MDLARVSLGLVVLVASCSGARTPGRFAASDQPSAKTSARTLRADAAAAEGPFEETVGLNVKFSQGEPEGDLPMLQDLGVRWVRDGVLWPELEPAPGRFRPFPADFARRLDYYRAHGIGVMFLLAYGNAAAYPPSPDDPLHPIDPVAFGRYAVEVARQLRGAGVRFVLEIWNEPHNFAIRPLAGGTWNGTPPSPWVDAYVKIVREAVDRVAELDPTIPLLDDEDVWVLHYRFLQAGLPTGLHGFAFHPYTGFAPERAAMGPDTDWAKPFVLVDADSSFESAVRRLREAGAARLATAPELWATEWGWRLGDRGPTGPITEDTVAAYLPRAYILAVNAGVRATFWFSSRDSVDGPMGLTTNDGQKRKAYFALRALTRQLDGTHLVEHVIGADHRVSGCQAFLFCSQPLATCKLVVWTADGPSRRLRLAGPLASAIVADTIGADVPAALDREGSRRVPVGPAPIYVRGLSLQDAAQPSFKSEVLSLLEPWPSDGSRGEEH
jgi:hypothetical protein